MVGYQGKLDDQIQKFSSQLSCLRFGPSVHYKDVFMNDLDGIQPYLKTPVSNETLFAAGYIALFDVRDSNIPVAVPFIDSAVDGELTVTTSHQNAHLLVKDYCKSNKVKLAGSETDSLIGTYSWVAQNGLTASYAKPWVKYPKLNTAKYQQALLQLSRILPHIEFSIRVTNDTWCHAKRGKVMLIGQIVEKN